MNENPGDPRFLDLDPAKVGSMVLQLPMISAQLRHATPAGTARDYLGQYAPPHPEAEFVYDLLTLSTDELCSKWYGGTQHAAVAFMKARVEW